jgi:hypothetical protein
VVVPLDYFENEAKDFARHNLLDFYSHPMFMKKYRKDDKAITTIGKV